MKAPTAKCDTLAEWGGGVVGFAPLNPPYRAEVGAPQGRSNWSGGPSPPYLAFYQLVMLILWSLRTVFEILFERKELILALQHLLVSHSKTKQ